MKLDTRSLQAASLIAGLALAFIAVLSAFGNFVALQPLVTPGDAAKTAIDISNSEAMFRWGIASLILVAVLDIVVAAALLRLFEPVNRSLSITAAWFRVAYAAVYLVAIIQLVLALGLLGDPDRAVRAIDVFGTIWLVGLILFGVHLLLIGYLAYRSGFMAKVFGILLAIAGLGYIADGFVAVLVRSPSISIGQFTFVGEVALMFWLLIKGTRMDFSDAAADQGHHFDPDSRWLADHKSTPSTVGERS
jgi:Domain of unknown function (DUF4386)